MKHVGKVHDYLSMVIDFRKKGKDIFNMLRYVDEMIEPFPHEIKPNDMAATPASDDLFMVKSGKRSKPLNQNKKEAFHTTVAQGLFPCKRARADLQPMIAWLCSRVKRVKNPVEFKWNKLV